MDPILAGFLASLAAGLATGLGALPSVVIKKTSDRALDTMLGFAAGIMVAAATFGLLAPSFQIGGLWVTAFSFLVGVVFLDFLNLFIPHSHLIRGDEGPSSRLRRIWLLVFAMVIHNIPEGFAVGVSFGQESLADGVVVAIGIGVQNLPEGLAVALPLRQAGYGKWRAVAYATLTGLAEPVAGIVGVVLVTSAHALLAFGLAFAAGAMLYVVFNEMIPESHSRGHQREATFGALAGLLLMMLLEYLFS